MSADAADDAAWPLRCSANPQLPAAAFCTVCRQPFSGKFLAVRQDGRAVCFACARRDDIPVHGVREAAERTGLFAGGWTRAALAMVLAPQRALASGGRTSLARLTLFAYGASMLGYALTLGWTYLLEYEPTIAALAERAASLDWEVTTTQLAWLPWASVPVIAALRVLLGGVALHLAVRIARPQDAAWPETLRAWALSNALLVFCVIPVIGPAVAMILWLSAMLGWFRERHGLGPLGTLAAVLPSLAVLTLVGPTPLS